jgi:RNA polymerase sigma-70 factor (ECF subfamily)
MSSACLQLQDSESASQESSLPPSPEEALVHQAQRGSQTALAELLQNNRHRAYKAARRIVGSNEDAEDIVQEAMLRAIRNFHSYRGDASFATWLTRITVNAALSEKRKTKHVQWIPLDSPADDNGNAYSIPLIEHRPNPEQCYMQSEIRALIARRMLQVLPPLRHSLMTSVLNETPVKDAARSLGIPEGTAKSHLRRARIDLARAVKWRSRLPVPRSVCELSCQHPSSGEMP